MNREHSDNSIETIQEIRDLMARSARVLSLSGWSGIWAGVMGLVGAAIARTWLQDDQLYNLSPDRFGLTNTIELIFKFLILGLSVFILAVVGGFYFTMRKNQKYGVKMWNTAGKKLLISLFTPVIAGGAFIAAFVWHNHFQYIAPACLIFYGLALVSAAKYTLHYVKLLGLLQLLLGFICLFQPNDGLLYWSIGFGLLHVLYGIAMWIKHDH